MVVVFLLIMLFRSSTASTHKDVGSSGNSQPAIELGGEEIASVLPNFTWIDSSSIRVILPSGGEDIIQLWPAANVENMLVPCLFEGNLKEDDTSAIAVSGCQHDDRIRIDIYANFLQGHAATFNIQNGITQKIGGQNIGKINNVRGSQEKKTRRKRDGNSGIAPVPPFLLYDVKFGYEESLLAKLGSHEAAQEYIMRVFTHAKVIMQHPSLGTKIRLTAQEPIQFVPNKYWSGASHASLNKAMTEARAVKQEEAVPIMFFVGTGTLSGSYTRKGCDPTKGIGIQPHQDDLEVAIVRYLHDVGHWIGLRHDEDEDSRGESQCAGTGLMSEQVEPEVRPKIWSSCSKSSFSKWFHRYGSCLKIDSVQLTGGSRPGEGNVYALNSENQLGPVCDDSWEDIDARVVCRQLGYSDGVATKQSEFGSVDSDFAMDDVRCNGDEARIQDCSYNIRDDCGGGEGAGVICTDLNVSATDGGWSVWSEYGSCSVTCGDGHQTRMRSCDNPAPAHGGHTCTEQNIGNATEIRECNLGSCAIDGGWSIWSEYGSCSMACGSGQQIRTRSCDNPAPTHGGRTCTEQNIGNATETRKCTRVGCVQLTGGSRPSEGNVYALNSENKLGPVCDDSWEDIDARVVCRQLGYADGVATKQSEFGSVDSDFAMDDVNCNGTEAHIQECSYNIRDDCGGGEGAGVMCTIPEYIGEFKNNQQNGHGTKTWPSGDKYIGQWKIDKKHGNGMFIWSDGRKYDGDWKENLQDGEGTYTWPDGTEYIGEFKNNQQNGQGTKTWPSGDKYIGQWKMDKKHGNGMFIWTDGGKYDGDWKNNLRDGNGTNTWPDGVEYVGEFKNNQQHGQGTQTWPSGNKYVGTWKNDTIHGNGMFIWSDGRKYDGDWKENMQDGNGTYTWPDGVEYVGEFKNNQQHGQGTKTWPSGNKYVGTWKNNKKYGNGIFFWSDGAKYDGEWRKDKQNGQGTMTSSNGKTWTGWWVDNKKQVKAF